MKVEQFFCDICKEKMSLEWDILTTSRGLDYKYDIALVDWGELGSGHRYHCCSECFNSVQEAVKTLEDQAND